MIEITLHVSDNTITVEPAQPSPATVRAMMRRVRRPAPAWQPTIVHVAYTSESK